MAAGEFCYTSKSDTKIHEFAGPGRSPTLPGRLSRLMKPIHRLLLFAFLLFAGLTLAGCTQAPTAVPIEYYPLEETFTQFYLFLGGEELLGKPISPLINEKKGIQKQYTENVLMVYDPRAEEKAQYYLGALGKDYGRKEKAPGSVPPQEGDLIAEGFVIYPDFVSLFQRFGSGVYSGKPTISAWVNEDEDRIEQHFANVGFYISTENPLPLTPVEGEEVIPPTPKLLPWGLMACMEGCIPFQEPTPLPLVGIGAEGEIPEPFGSLVASLDPAFLGKRLKGPYWAADGQREMIYENLVLYAQKGEVALRPVVKQLGYQRAKMVPPGDDPSLFFVEVKDGQGYNIPPLFYDYLMANGGLEISGAPITESVEISRNLYRQCFTNICLETLTAGLNKDQVMIRPLGREYLDQVVNAPEGAPTALPLTDDEGGQTPAVTGESGESEGTPAPTAPLLPPGLQFSASEAYPLLGQGQTQVLTISASAEGEPQAGLTFTITVLLPDGSQQALEAGPSNSEGVAQALLPVLELPAGSLVSYQVCLLEAPELPCTSGNYLLAGN